MERFEFLKAINLVQFLNWRIKDIIPRIPSLAKKHVTHILISPLQPTKEDKRIYWLLYQPVDFDIKNFIGTESDLQLLHKVANSYGIEVIEDVVLRHMAGQNNNPLYPHEKCNSYITSRRDFWLPPIQASDENNRNQIINRCFGTPALNYYNPEVCEVFDKYLARVLEYADGIRIDSAKHFALPYEGGIVFWDMIKKYRDMGKIIISECLNISQSLFNSYAEFGYVLTDIRPTENKDKAIVFAESHDTFYTDNPSISTRWKTSEEIYREYLRLKTQYPNTLYYLRPFDETFFEVA